jgi:hypothetical protein
LYRPVRAEGITAVRLTNRRAQPYYILANCRNLRYLKFSVEDHRLWELVDGTRTVKDLIFE